ncbi:MAG: PEP-CTERM sorting domain-containing protein [Opitutaceae bacterium]|jgi:hypothetical protein
MKSPTNKIRTARLALGLLAVLPCSLVSAASAYWDADATVNGTYGGTGTWNTSTANWGGAADGTGTDNVWNTADNATFLRGTTGTVTVDAGGISATAISFGVSAGSFTTGSTSYSLGGGKITLLTADNTNGIVASEGTTTIGNAIDFSTSVRVNITTAGTALNINGGMNFTAASAKTLLFFGQADNDTNIGALTKSGGTNALLTFGGATGSSLATYNLNGSNTGISNVTVNKGIVVVNNAGALGSGSFTFTGTVTGAETQTLLIGTSGITLSKTIAFTNNANSITDIRVVGSTITTGTATFSGNLDMRSGGSVATQVTSASGGTTVFSGLIDDSTETIGVTKTGAGIVKFTRPAGMNYDGGTTVSSGTLLVTNTSGSGTGTGAVTVSNTATFGGSGIVSGATTAASGSFLSPGSDAGVTGNLTFGGTLDISGLAGGTAGLLFDLDTTAASDKITLSSGALSIGTGALDLNDFSFTTLGGFGVGTYTLFDTSTSIVGSFGSNLTGTLGGFNAVLSFANGNQDIVLTVTTVPEPSTYAAILGTLVLVGTVWRRRPRALITNLSLVHLTTWGR